MESSCSRSINASNYSENRVKMIKIGAKQDQRLKINQFKTFKTANRTRNTEIGESDNATSTPRARPSTEQRTRPIERRHINTSLAAFHGTAKSTNWTPPCLSPSCSKTRNTRSSESRVATMARAQALACDTPAQRDRDRPILIGRSTRAARRPIARFLLSPARRRGEISAVRFSSNGQI